MLTSDHWPTQHNIMISFTCQELPKMLQAGKDGCDNNVLMLLKGRKIVVHISCIANPLVKNIIFSEGYQIQWTQGLGMPTLIVLNTFVYFIGKKNKRNKLICLFMTRQSIISLYLILHREKCEIFISHINESKILNVS